MKITGVANSKSDMGGFTLIELLITIIVLGIVITSLAGMYYIVQVTENKSVLYDLAVRDARTEIEDLRNNGYNSLSTGTFNFTLSPGLPSNAIGTVDVCDPALTNPCPPGLKRIDVTVTYTVYGQQQSVELSSNIGIIGITQT